MSDKSPPIKIHPMIIFGLTAMFGFGLGRTWPLPYLLTEGSKYLGYGISVFGGLLLLFASREFSRHNTSGSCNVCATTLIKTGPYRYSRNPVYVGILLILIGFSVKSNNLWFFILLPPLIVAISKLVISNEEAQLRNEFGDDYSSYAAAVRRWL